MKYLTTPNFENLPTSEGPKFVCSMSPLLRLAVQVMNADIKRHIVSVVNDIANNEEVANSLKLPSPIPGASYKRQVDVRATADSPVILKCFVSWDSDHEMWLILVEGAQEMYWENENKRVNEG